MSTRTLVEIDHDHFTSIEEAVPMLLEYLRNPWSGSAKLVKDELRHKGITIFGTRHHSDPYRIVWGYGDPINYEPNRPWTKP